jgi:uncharacterized protein YpbB
MNDIHKLIREIKDSYDTLGIVYSKDDIINVLIIVIIITWLMWEDRP